MVDVNNNVIELQVNGAKYSQFKEMSVTRSLDSIGGSFEAVIANKFISEIPIKVNDNVVVLVNNSPVLNGYINSAVPSYSSEDHSLNISGFDNTIDVVESSISASVEYNGPITLEQLIKKVLVDNGISDVIEVRDKAGGLKFEKGEIAAGKTSETIFEYIDRLARKKQCLLSSDGTGNIIIYRSSGIDIGAEIKNIANDDKNEFILGASGAYNFSKRFRTIIVRSQKKSADDIIGTAIDTGAREGRTKVIISDLATDTKTAQEIAVWEVNKRRSDSGKYNCSFQSFWATKGLIWKPNQLLNIQDDYADIKSKMLLDTVTYKISETTGSTADLTFVSPDTYSLNLQDPNSRFNKIGDNIIL